MDSELKRDVERLLRYGVKHRLIAEEDVVLARNALLDLLQLDEPLADLSDILQEDVPQSAVQLLERLLDASTAKGLIPAHRQTERDLFDARIMGLLMPRPSELTRSFYETAKNIHIKQATDDFYALSQASHYIRTDRIAKNEYWQTDTDYGRLEITINLSKPELDPKEIEAERAAPKKHYPKCLLCLENVGYAGRINHPARQNHRVIPVTLREKRWYMQFSPYVYYNEHCIVFSSAHEPMQISTETFARLLHFVEQFPHYFIGSNADLPIVGGSILNHDHFQGGRHRFAMEQADIADYYRHVQFPTIEVLVVKWPMSVVRLRGEKPSEITALASVILDEWRVYEDENVDIIAYSTNEHGARIPHNTITPIARRHEDGHYELDLVLRNNRTSKQHPHGIFHPHQELHHIKKENIGLIEVMGLAVLPGRLKSESLRLAAVLTGQAHYDQEEWKNDELVAKHCEWLEELTIRYGTSLKEEEAERIIREEISFKFQKVLEHSGVFKWDERGRQACEKWMESVGFHRSKVI